LIVGEELALRENTYKESIEQYGAFYRLPGETCNTPYLSSTFLIAVATSLFVKGFVAKA